MLLANLFLAASLLDATMEVDAVLRAIQETLSLKGSAFPYCAEYDLSLPPEPRVASGKAQRRFAAETPQSLYSEESRDEFVSRVLIQNHSLYWEYKDQDEGSLLFTAQAKLGAKTPESWLKEHLFVHNTYRDLDEDLLMKVRELLRDSKILERRIRGDGKDQEQRLTVSSKEYDHVIITVSRRGIEITGQKRVGKSNKDVTLVRYSYSEGKVLWSPDPRTVMLDKFSKAKKEDIHVLGGKITMPSAFEKALGNLREHRTVLPEETRRIAIRYGYLLPKKNGEMVVRKATTYFRELQLEIEMGKKVFTVSQLPPSSRSQLRNDQSMRPFITQKRKSGDYTVFEFKDPGTKEKTVFFLRGDTALVFYEPVDFNDKALDRLVSFFEKVSSKE